MSHSIPHLCVPPWPPQDWVARSQDEYVALAVRHATHTEALAALRSGLRGRMAASPLCDAPPFVARLEGVYRQLWRRCGRAWGGGGVRGCKSCVGTEGEGRG